MLWPCDRTFRPGPSRSSSPTSRARRGSYRTSARSDTRLRSPSIAAWSVRRSGRMRASRSTRRVTRSSSPSRGRRTRSPPPPRSSIRSPRARSACASACTPGCLWRRARGTSATTCTSQLASRPQGTGGKSSSRPQPRRSSGCAAPPFAISASTGCATSSDPSRSPSSARLVSAAQDALEHQPPASRELLRRPRAGARGAARAGGGGRPSPHPDRPGRLREDASCNRGGGHSRPRVRSGRVLGGSCAPARPRPRERDDRSGPRCEERARRAHRGARAARPARQPRTGRGGRDRRRSAPLHVPEPHGHRHEPRAAPRSGRSRVRGAAPRRSRGDHALLRTRSARTFRRDRRALRTPRFASARRRACCRSR